MNGTEQLTRQLVRYVTTNVYPELKIRPLPPDLKELKFVPEIKAIAHIRIVLNIPDTPPTISSFVYNMEPERQFEMDGITDDGFFYKDVYIHLRRTDRKYVTEAIARVIYRILIGLMRSGYTVEFIAAEPLGFYYIEAIPAEEMIFSEIKADPLISDKQLYRILKEYNIKIAWNEMRKLAREARSFHEKKFEKALRHEIVKIIKSTEKPSINKTITELRKEGIPIGPKTRKLVSKIFLQEVKEYREKYIEKIMKRIKRRKNIKTYTSLIREYRKAGYTGSEELLRKIAKKVMEG